jgi:hypothetical protein
MLGIPPPALTRWPGWHVVLFSKRWMLWSLPIVLAAVLLFGGGVAARDKARMRAELNDRRHRLGTLQLACKFFAVDHGGVMPPDLRAVFPRYLNDERYLAYAANEVDYFPGLTDNSPPNSVLVREKKVDFLGRRWIGHVDQSLELTRPDFHSLQPSHP